MYSLNVRDHIMIAHSFRGEIFGPAQRTHGATYVIDVCFQRPELDADGLVVDIGLASTTLHELLAELNFPNLDEEAAFRSRNTTTEFLARVIFDRVADAVRALQTQTAVDLHGTVVRCCVFLLEPLVATRRHRPRRREG